MDVIRHVRTEKGIAGLYRGMAPTLTREMAGNATMFAVYELLKRKAAAMQVRPLHAWASPQEMNCPSMPCCSCQSCCKALRFSRATCSCRQLNWAMLLMPFTL